MSAFIDFLKDKAGNIKYPRTLFKAVFDDDNNRLDNVISNLSQQLSVLSHSLTTLQNTVGTNTTNISKVKTTADNASSSISDINTAISTIQGNIDTINTTLNTLHKVAKSGSYNDLTNKPTIPTVYSGTADPSSGTGKNGDIYFKYES